jgi:hypothetical protein
MMQVRDDVTTALPPEVQRYLKEKCRSVARHTPKCRLQTIRSYFFRGTLQR